jgi:maleate isomerase
MSEAAAELRESPQRVIPSADADMRALQYGSRLRIGMIIPSVNSNAETHIAAMLPDGVALHTTRLRMDERDPEAMLHFVDHVEDASSLLKDAGCRHILVNCTAVTTADPTIGARIGARIMAATGLPSSTTGDGVVAALKALRARNVVMVTPYHRAVNEREVRYLEHFGCRVLDWEGLELNGAQEFDDVTPQAWRDLVNAHRNPEADAYFVSCAQVRVVEVIAQIESDLARPVITSNQAGAWYAVRQRGIADRVPGFGTLWQI